MSRKQRVHKYVASLADGSQATLDTRLTKTTGQVVLGTACGFALGAVITDLFNVDMLRKLERSKLSNAEIEKLSADLAEAISKSAEKDELLASLQARLASITPDDGVTTADVEAVRAELREVNAAKAALATQLSALQNLLKQRDSLTTDKDTALRDKERELSITRGKLRDAQAEVEKLKKVAPDDGVTQADVDAVITERDRLTAAKTALEDQIAALRSAHDADMAAIAAKDAEINSKVSEVAQQHARIVELEARVNAIPHHGVTDSEWQALNNFVRSIEESEDDLGDVIVSDLNGTGMLQEFRKIVDFYKNAKSGNRNLGDFIEEELSKKNLYGGVNGSVTGVWGRYVAGDTMRIRRYTEDGNFNDTFTFKGRSAYVGVEKSQVSEAKAQNWMALVGAALCDKYLSGLGGDTLPTGVTLSSNGNLHDETTSAWANKLIMETSLTVGKLNGVLGEGQDNQAGFSKGAPREPHNVIMKAGGILTLASMSSGDREAEFRSVLTRHNDVRLGIFNSIACLCAGLTCQLLAVFDDISVEVGEPKILRRINP